MRAFIVTTEYQLINAINIINSEKVYDDSEIILLEKDDRLSRKINLSYLNSKIRKVTIKKFRLHNNHFTKLLYTTMSLCMNRFKKKKYENVYIAGTEVYSKIIAYNILTKDGNLFFIEDGIESYMDVLNVQKKGLKDIPFKVIYGVEPLKKCRGMYVYEPECVINNSYNKPLLSIVRRKNDDSISLKDAFIEEPYYYNKSAIFFGAWFKTEKEYEYQDYLIKMIASIIGNDNLCVKMHPNDEKLKDRMDGIEYIKTRSNFEVSSGFQKMDNKILIAAISSACVTPKLINNQEPIVIFLYKLFESKFLLWDDVDEAIMRLLMLYKDKGRILIPKSEEELVSYLFTIKEKVL